MFFTARVFFIGFVLGTTQVPLAFVTGCRTYTQQGDGRVWVRGTKHATDKREATLQLCVRLGPGPQPKPSIIFRGTGTRIRHEERAAYDKRVDVLWQVRCCIVHYHLRRACSLH